MKDSAINTMTAKILLMLVTTSLVVAPSLAQSSTDSPDRKITKVGTTSAQFLKLGIGARAISMGGTFVAEANDLSALYWNPAGLANINGSTIQLAQTDYLADISYSHAAFGTNLGTMGTVAASLIFLDSGEMQVRTASEPEGTGERFKVQDMALQLSYGRALTDRFSIGTTVKYIRESIWHSSASAMAFVVGVQF